jgi:hypothetical protein
LQQLSAFSGSHRPTEIVGLSERTIVVLKEYELFPRFNAFRDHPHMQMAAHADHRSDDTGIVGICSDPVHK